MNDNQISPNDAHLWDLHVSGFAFPSVLAADELQIFEDLALAPASPEELAARLNLNRRAVRAILPQLAAVKLLSQRLGRYYLTDLAQTFLVRRSPYYWGPVFAIMRDIAISHASIKEAATAPEQSTRWDQGDIPADGWKTRQGTASAWSNGRIAPEHAKAIAAYMQANCLPAARAVAHRLDLSNVRRLLDVGAGSGCFSIAFAQSNPSLHCTMMELDGMSDIAMTYVRAAGMDQSIRGAVVDMLRDPWPQGHDAIFLSNIFHDWDFDTCAMLVGKAYETLPSGGRIHVHEMLLEETHDGPPAAVAFSMFMLIATKGQQFTATEVKALLMEGGFKDPRLTPAHGNFFVVSAEKP